MAASPIGLSRANCLLAHFVFCEWIYKCSKEQMVPLSWIKVSYKVWKSHMEMKGTASVKSSNSEVSKYMYINLYLII